MVTQAQFAAAVYDFNTRISRLLLLCKAAGLRVKITCRFRSDKQQETLYSIGRTRPGRIATNCRPGQSPHNHELATDFAILVNGKCDWNGSGSRWRLFGVLVREAKLTWGGNFKSIKDCPHVELPGWTKYKKVK
ncbi:MAG: M15 family metallopeptidase [Candidatus Atribacteria bacterium]|nr:M15 family metallopeptidase [Candidatus Atribacteria bacterium]